MLVNENYEVNVNSVSAVMNAHNTTHIGTIPNHTEKYMLRTAEVIQLHQNKHLHQLIDFLFTCASLSHADEGDDIYIFVQSN